MRYYSPRVNERIDGLMADFEGLANMEKAVDSVLRRLELSRANVAAVRDVVRGGMSRSDYDKMFAEMVRLELGKVLGIMRAKAVQKASAAGAGSASSAVLRRTYKNELAENINIGGNRKRISSRLRVYETGTKKHRHVGERTRKINEYYGPDRSFILRFLEFGTDVRTAKSFGPVGNRSTATWGNRGSVSPRSFFHSMSSDMEQAAQQLGFTLTDWVERFVEKAFKEGE